MGNSCKATHCTGGAICRNDHTAAQIEDTARIHNGHAGRGSKIFNANNAAAESFDIRQRFRCGLKVGPDTGVVHRKTAIARLALDIRQKDFRAVVFGPGESDKTPDGHGSIEATSAKKTQLGQGSNTGGMDQFAGQSAVGMLSRLNDKDRPAKFLERCRSSDTRYAATRDNHIVINMRHENALQNDLKPSAE